MKARMFYRLENEVGIGVNLETGKPCEAYICVKVDAAKHPTEEGYKELCDGFRKIVANQLDCQPQYVTTISEQEYLENVDDGEEDL